MGLSLNFAVMRLRALAERLTGAPETYSRRAGLNPARTAIALVLHFALTPAMLLQVAYTRRAHWAGRAYKVYRGRVSSVVRVNCSGN